MTTPRAILSSLVTAVVALCASISAATAEVLGQPTPWGLGFQQAASDTMAQIRWFETYTLVIITAITLFVLALLVWVVIRYRASANPTPSRTTHNTMIEVVWTIVPVLILVAIAFPSFRLLYNQTTIPEPDLTLKVIGGAWYWQYEYQDDAYADIGTITSNMLQDNARQERMEEYGLSEVDVPRLLAVDYPVVVPEGAVVHLLTTALDVNHAMAWPVLGVKADSVVGRLNESWFEATATGVFYGQCSQLCGQLHAFMPLEMRVVTQERFDEWAAAAKEDLDVARDLLLTWQAEDAGVTQTPVAALSN
ncbi:MAG: cytochrome c oxidase subunit II [Pseudomonadota bacterium]